MINGRRAGQAGRREARDRTGHSRRLMGLGYVASKVRHLEEARRRRAGRLQGDRAGTVITAT